MAKKTIYTSPAGEAKFVHVTKPNTKFKEQGEYSVDLLLTKEEAAALRKQVNAAIEATWAERVKEKPKTKTFGKYNPISMDLDEDGNETGKVLVKFKNVAAGKRKDGTPFNVRIDIFDAKKQKLIGKNIGRGSVMKVAFEIVPISIEAKKEHGVQLRLQAVQILDLKEFGQRDAGAYGFGEEAGFAGEQADESATETAGAGESGAADNF